MIFPTKPIHWYRRAVVEKKKALVATQRPGIGSYGYAYEMGRQRAYDSVVLNGTELLLNTVTIDKLWLLWFNGI